MNPIKNDYYQAIKQVREILQYYDTNKKIPAYGFGASIESDTNFFALNGNMEDPDCDGVDGVIEAYYNCL